MHRAAAEQYKRSSKFNNQTYNHNLIFKGTAPVSFLQTHMPATFKYYIIQSLQSSVLSAEKLIRMVLHIATFKGYHHKSVLPDEEGLFLLRPLHFTNPERLNTVSKKPR